MDIEGAIKAPTSINMVHESCYKSYQTMLIVKEMLDRRDSYETIRQIIDAIYSFELPPRIAIVPESKNTK